MRILFIFLCIFWASGSANSALADCDGQESHIIKKTLDDFADAEPLGALEKAVGEETLTPENAPKIQTRIMLLLKNINDDVERRFDNFLNQSGLSAFKFVQKFRSMFSQIKGHIATIDQKMVDEGVPPALRLLSKTFLLITTTTPLSLTALMVYLDIFPPFALLTFPTIWETAAVQIGVLYGGRGYRLFHRMINIAAQKTMEVANENTMPLAFDTKGFVAFLKKHTSHFARLEVDPKFAFRFAFALAVAQTFHASNYQPADAHPLPAGQPFQIKVSDIKRAESLLFDEQPAATSASPEI